MGEILRTPMSCITTQKREGGTCRRESPGPLLSLLMLFGNPDAAELFRVVRWANGVCCPTCGK